jgi:hypothetical protein
MAGVNALVSGYGILTSSDPRREHCLIRSTRHRNTCLSILPGVPQGALARWRQQHDSPESAGSHGASTSVRAAHCCARVGGLRRYRRGSRHRLSGGDALQQLPCHREVCRNLFGREPPATWRYPGGRVSWLITDLTGERPPPAPGGVSLVRIISTARRPTRRRGTQYSPRARWILDSSVRRNDADVCGTSPAKRSVTRLWAKAARTYRLMQRARSAVPTR